jgi:hypothetical protein
MQVAPPGGDLAMEIGNAVDDRHGGAPPVPAGLRPRLAQMCAAVTRDVRDEEETFAGAGE